jgi:hypothetical protein
MNPPKASQSRLVLLVTMSVQVGAVLPVGVFLRDNARALCAVAVCCGGAVSLWSAAAGRVRLLPGLAVVGRPRTARLRGAAATGQSSRRTHGVVTGAEHRARPGPPGHRGTPDLGGHRLATG